MVYKSKQTNQIRQIINFKNGFGVLYSYCIFDDCFILKITPNIFYYGKKNNRCNARRWHW